MCASRGSNPQPIPSRVTNNLPILWAKNFFKINNKSLRHHSVSIKIQVLSRHSNDHKLPINIFIVNTYFQYTHHRFKRKFLKYNTILLIHSRFIKYLTVCLSAYSIRSMGTLNPSESRFRGRHLSFRVRPLSLRNYFTHLKP